MARDPEPERRATLRPWRDRDMCASPTLTRPLRRCLSGLGLVLAAALVVAPWGTLLALNTAALTLYLLTLGYRLVLFRHALTGPPMPQVSDEAAKAVPDGDLPSYSLLVPAYREPEVIDQLFHALGAIDYPRDRLEVLLLLESDDRETITAVGATAARTPLEVEVVLIPPGHPRTKPRALNHGLLQARGELLTVYDADDIPEPLQLRRAAAVFRAEPAAACLQARLSFYNPRQSRITRWFQTEYAVLFSHLLPGLARCGAPVPLGGTSNHFRRAVLLTAGGWDPFNVTEDADLGIRLHRLGHPVQVLDSVTLEEANTDFVNWVKQRSRWHKGYLQTWLVHLRQPRRLLRELGWRGFLSFNLLVGGGPLLSMVNLVVWTLTAMWLLLRPAWIAALFPAWLYYWALLSFGAGNFAHVYMNVVAARRAGQPELVGTAILSPLYWVMMSLATVKALLQLATGPSFWEKTAHGLHLAGPPDTGPVAR